MDATAESLFQRLRVFAYQWPIIAEKVGSGQLHEVGDVAAAKVSAKAMMSSVLPYAQNTLPSLSQKWL
ncbi:hypothetical protein CJO88_13275 [Ralstonia solanacearum]|nr:hypothetical protein CJO88_13275 [Ralstonia solanacearum]